MRSRAMLGIAAALALGGMPITSDGLTGHSPFPDTSGDAKRAASRDDEERIDAAEAKRRRRAAKRARPTPTPTDDA